MRGAEQVVGALAVLEPEDAVAVLGPAAGRLVGLARAAAPGTAAPGRRSRPSPRGRSSRCCAAPAGPAAARCRCRARRGGCSRRGPAAGGSAPRRPRGRRAGCARTGWTSAGSWGRRLTARRRTRAVTDRRRHRVGEVVDRAVAARQRRQPVAALDGGQDRRRVVDVWSTPECLQRAADHQGRDPGAGAPGVVQRPSWLPRPGATRGPTARRTRRRSPRPGCPWPAGRSVIVLSRSTRWSLPSGSLA